MATNQYTGKAPAGWSYLGPTAYKKLTASKYNPASLRRYGTSFYLAPNESKRLGFAAPAEGTVVNTDVQNTDVAAFDPTSFAKALADEFRKSNPSVARPTFDASGLYNEADARAQAEAEFNPYFQEEGQTLETSLARAAQARAQNQQEQGLQQEQSYLQRGLAGRVGGQIANQQALQQQQALANTQAGEQATQQRKALTQKKAGALEDYRKNAYSQAWTRYLAQFS